MLSVYICVCVTNNSFCAIYAYATQSLEKTRENLLRVLGMFPNFRILYKAKICYEQIGLHDGLRVVMVPSRQIGQSRACCTAKYRIICRINNPTIGVKFSAKLVM